MLLSGRNLDSRSSQCRALLFCSEATTVQSAAVFALPFSFSAFHCFLHFFSQHCLPASISHPYPRAHIHAGVPLVSQKCTLHSKHRAAHRHPILLESEHTSTGLGAYSNDILQYSPSQEVNLTHPCCASFTAKSHSGNHTPLPKRAQILPSDACFTYQRSVVESVLTGAIGIRAPY